MRRNLVGLVAACVLALWIVTEPALADEVIAGSGGAAGQVRNPQGIAVDTTTGALYVADGGNNRIDVFDAAGSFVKAFGWGVVSGKNALQTCSSSCQPGSAGAGEGQFERPGSVAVDLDPLSPSFRDVYVFDNVNRRVEKFDASGPEAQYLLSITSPGEAFDSDASIAVGSDGSVYVADSVGPHGSLSSRVQRFSDSGAFLEAIPITPPPDAIPPNEAQILQNLFGVDEAGSFYVGFANFTTVQKYSPSGTPLSSVGGVRSLVTLAVGPGGQLVVAGAIEPTPITSVLELGADGKPVRQFGYGNGVGVHSGVAPVPNGAGDVYLTEPDGGQTSEGQLRRLMAPPPGPLVLDQPCANTEVGNIRAVITCRVNPEGSPTTAHFQYTDGHGETKETAESLPFGEDFNLHEVPLSLPAAGEADLTPETTYHYRIVATNPDAASPIEGPEGSFTTKPPFECGSTFATEVSESAATLHSEVNPLGLAATGTFEYVDDATFQQAGFTGATKVPDGAPLDLGHGTSFKAFAAAAGELLSGTTYHYRLSVTDKFGTRPCPPQIFTTPRAGAGALPDSRGYELVSPAMKENGEAGTIRPSGGLSDTDYQIIWQAATGGDAVTFTSFSAFADPKGAPGASQYLSTRTSDGWSTRNLTPPSSGVPTTFPMFRGFTPDLSVGAFVLTQPALTDTASSRWENLYRQQGPAGDLATLTPTDPVPGNPNQYCVGFGGATPNGSRMLVIASGALTSDAPLKTGFSLYEWTADAGLKLVSVLPGETPAPPAAGTSFGAKSAGCGDGSTIVDNAMSADGRRIFWTFEPKTGPTRLLARVDGSETVQIDAKQGGLGASGNGQYWGASDDGSRVIFSDESKLVPGAGENDLFRYSFAEPVGQRLTDLTSGSPSADVKGVLAMDSAARHVYFVAGGVLSTDPNSHGEAAVGGANNLYVWSDGSPVKFIARLSHFDQREWQGQPKTQYARTTGDGETLAFLSHERLTGYDNSIDGTTGCALSEEGVLVEEETGEGHDCNEAFLYSNATDTLFCVSCNPSGGRPIGPAQLTGWRSPFHQPGNLSEDGGRLFFQSLDALVPRDTNQRLDVYEYERPGVGSCTTGSPSFSEDGGGCLFPISTGTSPDESYFVDASPDGHDVFFSTRQPLVAQDEDERFDVYDARVDGGFPSPPSPPSACVEEGCRPSVPQREPLGESATATSSSEGNVKPKGHKAKRKGPKGCAKGKRKAKRHGKTVCVKKGAHRGNSGR